MIQFTPMTRTIAQIISDWTYPPPFELYSMDGGEECISELMNGDYDYATDSNDGLIGFICCGESARVPGGYPVDLYSDPDILDIGLGLRPDLTGQGRGCDFLKQALEFLGARHEKSAFQLVVATFNERAIRTYTKSGFQDVALFYSVISGMQIPFKAMRHIL